MQTKLVDQNKLYIFILGILIIFGFYLCFIGGYGSDEDTLPMIYVFESRLFEGKFVSSRFTSYPVPEIGIGFLSYYLGSWAANSATFILHIAGLSFIFFSFFKKIELNNFFIFLILCLSNQVLFFDNLEPIDYPWAFFFLSLGCFFLSKKYFEIGILALAFAVGSRLNFLVFAFIVIFFIDYGRTVSINRKLINCFCVFIISGLFYLPIWYHNSFNLDWLTAARPIEQGFLGLFARFSYKTIMAIGVIQFFFIIFVLLKNYKKKIFQNNFILLFLIISNLFIFLYIPAELSYLQPALIFLYLFFIKEISKNLIMVLIILNFINWAVNFDFLKINYKDASFCSPKQAISANFQIRFLEGGVKKYLSSRDMINCWVNDTERGRRISEGKSTKISK